MHRNKILAWWGPLTKWTLLKAGSHLYTYMCQKARIGSREIV